jgi:hypothetical protein
MTKPFARRVGAGLLVALAGAPMLTACRGGEETAKREAQTDTTAVADTTPAAADTTQR